jgi:hypothetical protein
LREFAEAGRLLSYGAGVVDAYRPLHGSADQPPFRRRKHRRSAAAKRLAGRRH